MLRVDGTWWAQLDRGDKLAAVILATEAFEDGYGDGYLRSAVRYASPSNAAKPIETLAADGPYFPHTYGFYVSAIDDYYALHNKPKTPVAAVLSCLQIKPQVSCDKVATHF